MASSEIWNGVAILARGAEPVLTRQPVLLPAPRAVRRTAMTDFHSRGIAPALPLALRFLASARAGPANAFQDFPVSQFGSRPTASSGSVPLGR